MKGPGEIWRQRLWVWVPALLFFLANATAYTVYRFGFADRVASLQEDLKTQKDRLDRWRRARRSSKRCSRARGATTRRSGASTPRASRPASSA